MECNNLTQDNLGKPDIALSGLQIWVHNRQFPDLVDYWDANWINVNVHCGGQGASVWVNGNIIHLSEIFGFLQGAEQLFKELNGKAELHCMEPYLLVELEAKKHGQIEMTVNITPDNLSQKHEFLFNIDQSYLPNLILECKEVLEKYPIKGSV